MVVQKKTKTRTKKAPKKGTKAPLPIVTTQSEYISWERDKIVQALEKEGEIPLHIAKEVAKLVEEKIIASQVRYITTAQIRELVNSELFSMKHSSYWIRQSVLGIPKFNLKRILYHQHFRIADACEDVAKVILHQYALDEIYAAEIMEEHFSGAMDLMSISYPLKLFSYMLSIDENPVFQKVKDSHELVCLFLSIIQKIRSITHYNVNVKGVEEVLPWTSSFWKVLITSLTHNFQNFFPLNIYMSHFSEEKVSVICQLCRELDEEGYRNFLPTWIIPVAEKDLSSPHLRELCQVALQTRKIIFNFEPSGMISWPTSPLNRCCTESIGINLVRAACKAGVTNFGGFWDELQRIFSIVIKAHLDKKRFLSGLSGDLLATLEAVDPTSKSTPSACFLEVYGLAESILFLTGAEMQHNEGWELAVQTLSRLKELAEDVAKKHGVIIILTNYALDQDVAHRFIRQDMERYPVLQDILSQGTYTRGAIFPFSTSLSIQEKIEKEGQLHRFAPTPICLLPDMVAEELIEYIEFALTKTDAIGLKIK